MISVLANGITKVWQNICSSHNICSFNKTELCHQRKKENHYNNEAHIKSLNQWLGSGDLLQPIPGRGWSDDFKTPTQVAVTCSSSAHILDHNFHDCTSHDSVGKQD